MLYIDSIMAGVSTVFAAIAAVFAVISVKQNYIFQKQSWFLNRLEICKRLRRIDDLCVRGLLLIHPELDEMMNADHVLSVLADYQEVFNADCDNIPIRCKYDIVCNEISNVCDDLVFSAQYIFSQPCFDLIQKYMMQYSHLIKKMNEYYKILEDAIDYSERVVGYNNSSDECKMRVQQEYLHSGNMHDSLLKEIYSYKKQLELLHEDYIHMLNKLDSEIRLM